MKGDNGRPDPGAVEIQPYLVSRAKTARRYTETGRLKIISTLKSDLRRKIAGLQCTGSSGITEWMCYYYAAIYQLLKGLVRKL